MKRFVRFSGLGLAVFSALYWQLVIMLRDVVPTIQQAAYNSEPRLLQGWFMTGLPSIIYGFFCVLFCHWFARKIAYRLKLEV